MQHRSVVHAFLAEFDLSAVHKCSLKSFNVSDPQALMLWITLARVSIRLCLSILSTFLYLILLLIIKRIGNLLATIKRTY